MKIVVLDGYTLNPGDLTWSGFESLGDFTCYHRTSKDEIIERAKDADIIITNKTPLRKETLEKLPKCKYIGVLATGYDVVDYNFAKEINIPVCNIPTYGTVAVAQYVFALLLELCHNVKYHSDTVKTGKWSAQQDFCYWDFPLVELAGKTMGFVGFGRIGKQTAKIAEAFGMNIIANDKFQGDVSEFKNFKWVELDELFREADVVSLHCPLFPDTEGIINRENLSKMKRTAFLINTSRGKLVVEKDLAEALNNEKISGAAVDVVCSEPPTKDNPLFTAKNCIVTPHIAWATKEARQRLMDIAVDNLKGFLNKSPKNVVNLKENS
jgi:glycerate dehydrogenase